MTTDADLDHTSRDHAVLGASSSYRWWNCAGSLNLATKLCLKNSSSLYAKEGTAAHELAHMCLLSSQDTIEYIDRKLEVEGHTFIVDDEMASAVQVYVDVCRSYRADGVECLTEKRFNLKKLNPPAPMFGTGDFVAINRATGKVTIVDLKYGKGVVVAILNNPQLMYYALGVLCALPADVQVREIETVVVQPRVSTKPKRATYRPIELFEWSIELLNRAKATMEPDAPCKAGPWCRSTFCPVSGRCPTEAAGAFKAAQIEFSAELLEGEVLPPEKMPALRGLTPQEKGALKRNFEVLKGFMSSLDESLEEDIKNGALGTGWKLVSEEGNRQWTDKENVAPQLIQKLGLTLEETKVTKTVSPAEAERIAVGKLRALGMKKKDAEPMAKQVLKMLTVRPPTKPSLVSDANEHPALPARGSEFVAEMRALPTRENE